MKIIRTGGQKNFNDLPLKVNWILTMQCNYRCSYCFDYGSNKLPPKKKPFSTLEQLKNAINNLATLNRPWYEITFSGGEPTIHPHIFDLISMIHETLGERLNWILIITNGSRNKNLYCELAKLAKFINIKMQISLHTDHVEMSHILELIENLSADISMNFSLMFNPDKREFVHEIYETMFEYRKKFWFNLNVVTLRLGDRVDPRYTPEDFAWQKNAIKQFNDIKKNLADLFPPRRKSKYSNPVIRDIEDNGEIKTVTARNRTLELADGLLAFKGMYCIAHSALVRIAEDGRCNGMVCSDDRPICNIYEKNSFEAVRENLIHPVTCTKRICGCASNDPIPKFASEEDAKKYVEFAQERQAELFAEYVASHAIQKI